MRSGVWKGSISFGLLNIPVSAQTAQAEKGLHFKMLDSKDLSPIHFKRVNQDSGHEVPYERIVKGFEYKRGEYVVMTKKDFENANVKATQAIDLEDCVLLEEIDPLLFDKPYYLVPQKGGEKGYALLRDALSKTKKVAIGKIVLRTKQHLVAVMPREDYLILEILRFDHEVIEVSEAKYLEESDMSKGKYSARELKMAEELIKGMTSEWKPEQYKDTYYDDLKKRIQKKVKAGKGHLIEEKDEEIEEIKPSKVIDLLPLLRQSLAAKKVGGKKTHSRSRSHA